MNISESCTQNPQKTALSKRGYKFIKKINNGTFANVFLAEYVSNKETGERIFLACKVMNFAKLINEKVISLKFIQRELAILTKLNHPYVISVHSILQWFNKYYIFMPYAANGDLLQYIRDVKDVIPEQQCRIWFRQLSLGIQYIHKMEIAHRDIKCENILLTSEMNIKLADFGFARYVIDNSGMQILSDTYCGSIYYIAPEVMISTPYNPKISDMWSMGVILFMMLNKQMPFKIDNAKRMYQQQIECQYKFRTKGMHLYSDQAKVLLHNLLEPDVTLRWSIEQVLICEWFMVNSQEQNLSLEEQEALNNAILEIKKQKEKIINKQELFDNIVVQDKTTNTSKINKNKDFHELYSSVKVNEHNGNLVQG